MDKSLSLLLLSLTISTVAALDNGVGLTPAMGWSTWNKYGCSISSDVIKLNVDKIVELGLDKIGYTYVNIDDCWQLGERNSQGRI